MLVICIMKLKWIPYLLVAIVLCCVSCTKTEETISEKTAKVGIRSVGNQLLKVQNDTASLVLPVVRQSKNVYKLSFENSLSFDPADLNAIVSNVFSKTPLPKAYVAEVLLCETQEVAYSFQIIGKAEENLIPCGGRILPEDCYTIQFTFAEDDTAPKQDSTLFYSLVFLVLAFLAFVFYSRYTAYHTELKNKKATNLGSFSFYPEQNKLVKAAQEISLTQKECELLAIFVAHINQVVKREELTKRVWEDNGVIVGRSLDTYISKLRKKLKDDASIKITNVHGVGYKLEIER